MTLHAKSRLIEISRYGYFHGRGREIVENSWNVSEISLSRREKSHGHPEKFYAVKKVTVTVKIFHTGKKCRYV